MPNLSFCYLSKSIWKDKNSVKKLKELWRKITHTYKGVFHQWGSTVSALFSSPLPSAGSHRITHITKDIRHEDAAVSTGRGSACIPLLPCTWAPQGCFKVQFNSPALIQKDNLPPHMLLGLVSAPGTAPSRPAKYYNSRPPSPACSCFSCICPCCCPCASAWEGRAAFCPCWILSLSCPQSDGKSTSCFFLSTA